MKRILKRSLSVVLSILIAVSTMVCLTTSATAISYTGSASYMSGKYYKQLTNVSLTGNGATDIVNVAISQIGYKSGSSNNDLSGQTSSTSNVKYSEYGRVIGSNPNDWCAYFVSWCARQAGISKSVLPNFTRCTPAYNTELPNAGCKMHRRTSGYIPKAGDIIFFGNASDDIYHVGIVKSATSSKVYYIDGNNTNTKPHSVSDSSRSLSSTSIWGYATPNYAGSSGGSSSCTCSTSYSGNYTCTTANYPLTIRSGHGTSYSSLGSIPSGATVSVSKANGSWAHVTYNGISGYASMEYLEKKCSHSYSTKYEAAHPHRVYKKCSCGDWYYTGATKELNTCSSCWNASFNVSVSSLSLEVGETKTITYSVNGCLPDTRKLVYSRNTSLVSSSATTSKVTLTGIAPGKFNLKLYVYSDDTKTTLINSVSIPVTVTTTNYTGTVSFDKSSMSLVMPTKTSDTLKINLSGTWPDGAGYLFDYDEDIISLSQNGKELTITAKKTGSTDLAINIVNQNNNNSLITSASCDIYVTNAKYTVKYDANGGTGAPSSQTKTYGTALILSDLIPQKTGYGFSGWTSNPDGSGTYKTPGSSYTLEQDMLFYAYYKPIEYTIRYAANGGLGTTSSSAHTYDSEKTLSSNSFTREGYTFLGWSTEPDSTIPTYYDCQSVENLSTKNGSVVTLYAVWKEVFYGDLNDDKVIDFNDVLLMNKIISGNEASLWAKITGDLDGDGEITGSDLEYLNEFRVGNSFEFPVESLNKSLVINTPANKSQYFVDDLIDIDGLTVVLYYNKSQVLYDVTQFSSFYFPNTDSIGSKMITISFKDLEVDYEIRVTQPTITLSESSKTITKGNTATITATTNPSGQSITWSSSNTSVATVTNGKITAKTSGSATITAKFVYNGITYNKTCSVTVVEPAHTHTAGSWIIDKNATCTVNGSKHKECTSCGESLETAVIYAIGHTSVKDFAVAATCTTAGKTEGSHCSVCNTVIKAQSTIPAKGHTASDWIIDKNATASATGTKYKKCTACGTKLETATIPQLKPATPKVTSTNAIGGVQVNWNKIDGAVKYVIYRRGEKQTGYTQIGTTTSTTFLDKNVASGKYYCYTVRAFNSAGGYSDYIYANTSTRKYMAVPKLTGISNATNGLYIKWNEVAGVTNGYRVYRRGAGQTTWTYLGTTKNLYFIDSAVKNRNGEYYRYTVIADGGYHSKFDTTGLYLRRLANPTLNSAVSSKSGITVKWGKVAGSSGYYVYRKTANSTWTRVGVVSGVNNLSYLDKTAKKGTTYTYTVRAVYGNTLSSYYSGINCKDKY